MIQFAAGRGSPRRRVRIVAALLFVLAAAAALAEPFTEGRLWRISKPGTPDSYVFGTIHVADPRVSVVPQQVESALARSRTLATELTAEAAAGTGGTDLEEAPDGQRLETLLGKEDYALLRVRLLAQDIPERSIERMKPWAAMLKNTRAASGRAGVSLDERLFSIARARRMRVVPLEFVEEQIAAFDAIPPATQVALLRHSLQHRDAIMATNESTIDSWLRGDLAALARVCDTICIRFPELREHYAALKRHIVDDRTALLHHRLFVPLREGRVFVAVGAMHLHGELGLLALLREDGYRVRRVW